MMKKLLAGAVWRLAGWFWRAIAARIRAAASDHRRTDMSTLVKAAIVSFIATIEALSRTGVKAGGTWYPYARKFQGSKPEVGGSYELTVVTAKDKKKYLLGAKPADETVEVEPDAGGEEPSPGEAEAGSEAGSESESQESLTPTPGTLSEAQRSTIDAILSEQDLTVDDLNAALASLKRKSLDELNTFEASGLIRLLGRGRRS